MNELKHIIAIALLGLSVAGCSKPTTTPPSAPPMKVALPDKELMLTISRKAIETRLPDVRFADLELHDLAYRWSIENAHTNEQFQLNFRVRGSKRKEKEDGETVFKVNTVGVDIGIDGRIDKPGVSKGVQMFRSSAMKRLDGMGIQSSPVWGDPFYPVKLSAPLPVPSKDNLKEIAFMAMRRFLPNVDIYSLVLRDASFIEMHNPEDDIEHSGFWLTFWITNSVVVTETDREIIVKREKITVQIDTNGQVNAKGVLKSPGNSTHYKHNLEGRTNTFHGTAYRHP